MSAEVAPPARADTPARHNQGCLDLIKGQRLRVSSADEPYAVAGEVDHASAHPNKASNGQLSNLWRRCRWPQGALPLSRRSVLNWRKTGAPFLINLERLIQSARDDLEAVKLTTGAGANEPEGLLVGATTTVATGGAGCVRLGRCLLAGGLPFGRASDRERTESPTGRSGTESGSSTRRAAHRC
jgi:hypothetical protein